MRTGGFLRAAPLRRILPPPLVCPPRSRAHLRSACARTHTHTHPRTHARACTHIHAHAHTCSHAHTDTHMPLHPAAGAHAPTCSKQCKCPPPPPCPHPRACCPCIPCFLSVYGGAGQFVAGVLEVGCPPKQAQSLNTVETSKSQQW